MDPVILERGRDYLLRGRIPYLMTAFPEEIKDLFQMHIEKSASQSSTRKDYQNVCRIIRMLHQVGGKVEAVKTVYSLLGKYPSKPAFREELMNVKRILSVD